MGQLITMRELAERMQCSVNTIRRAVAAGQLQPLQIPGSRLVRFEEAAVMAVLRSRQPSVSEAMAALQTQQPAVAAQ